MHVCVDHKSSHALLFFLGAPSASESISKFLSISRASLAGAVGLQCPSAVRSLIRRPIVAPQGPCKHVQRGAAGHDGGQGRG